MTGTHRGLVRGRVAAGAFVLGVVAAGASIGFAQTAVTAGYRDFSYGTTAISTPTGEKPESKLWWNDGSWWGSLFSAAGKEYRIHEFDVARQSWQDTGTAIDNRGNSKADVLWDEASGRLYVVSHVFSNSGSALSASSQWGRLYRYTYDPSSRRYTLDAGFPVAVNRSKSETLTVAKDGVGRLWVTWVEAGRVMVNWSRAHDLDWGTPVALPVAGARTLASDDISAVLAFGAGQVGIAWSNENETRTYFSVRADTDPPETWQPAEDILPACSGACADDHLNLTADGAGRVFVATKTSFSGGTFPLVVLAVRSAESATWSNYTVGLERDHHTRPVVLLDEENRRVYVFATSGESGGAIFAKSAPLDDIAFEEGLGEPFIASAWDDRVNNPTSTKQGVNSTTGLLVAASDQETRFYLHNHLALGTPSPPPAAPAALSATAVSSTRVDLSWTDASSNEDAFYVERASGGGDFSEIASVAANATGFSDTSVQAATTYSYRVRAGSAAGFSGYSNVATLTAPPSVVVTAPDAPSGLAALAVSGARVDLSWTDASDDEDEFEIERAAGTGDFAGLVVVPANFTAYSDTTVAASTSYRYRVRARNGAGASAYSNEAAVTTPGDQPADTLPIKTITFESASLTDTGTGADKAVGNVSLEAAGALKGAYSARIPNEGSTYLEESFDAADDLYASLYVRLNALPGSDVRLVLVSNGGTSVGNIVVRPGGELRLRAGSSQVGLESPALSVGQIYRVGIRQGRGRAGDAVLEAFLAAGDDPFGVPFASTAAGTWTTPADRLRVGATSPGALDVVLDEIRLDAAGMR